MSAAGMGGIAAEAGVFNKGVPSRRKPFNDRAGYRASRRAGMVGPDGKRGWVVIYMAEASGLDGGGCRYVVSCETHGVNVGVTSMPHARSAMKSVDFCEACAAAKGGAR